VPKSIPRTMTAPSFGLVFVAILAEHHGRAERTPKIRMRVCNKESEKRMMMKGSEMKVYGGRGRSSDL
jgi:hypothetical protein